MTMDDQVEANANASGEPARLVVLNYLQKVLSAINAVLDETSHISGNRLTFSLDQRRASSSPVAFSPEILTAPVPSLSARCRMFHPTMTKIATMTLTMMCPTF
jgi:hypothetical protein